MTRKDEASLKQTAAKEGQTERLSPSTDWASLEPDVLLIHGREGRTACRLVAAAMACWLAIIVTMGIQYFLLMVLMTPMPKGLDLTYALVTDVVLMLWILSAVVLYLGLGMLRGASNSPKYSYFSRQAFLMCLMWIGFSLVCGFGIATRDELAGTWAEFLWNLAHRWSAVPLVCGLGMMVFLAQLVRFSGELLASEELLRGAKRLKITGWILLWLMVAAVAAITIGAQQEFLAPDDVLPHVLALLGVMGLIATVSLSGAFWKVAQEFGSVANNKNNTGSLQ